MPEEDVNKMYDYVSDMTQNCIQTATTQKTVRLQKNKQAEWLKNNNIVALIKRRDNLWKKHKTAIKNKQCEDIIRKLKTMDKRIDYLKAQAKTKHYSDLFKNCNTTKQTWKNINSILKPGGIKKVAIDLSDGSVLNKNEYTAETFVTFFQTIGTERQK